VVLRVLDGDTAEVSTSARAFLVRLSNIDCPENGQTWGAQATTALCKLIDGREVYLETYGRDHYGRTLATVYVMLDGELVNVNEDMVMRGHAWVMDQFHLHLSLNRRRNLDKLQRWAKSKRVGLWQDENPIAPWLWRANAG